VQVKLVARAPPGRSTLRSCRLASVGRLRALDLDDDAVPNTARGHVEILEV